MINNKDNQDYFIARMVFISFSPLMPMLYSGQLHYRGWDCMGWGGESPVFGLGVTCCGFLLTEWSYLFSNCGSTVSYCAGSKEGHSTLLGTEAAA